MFGYRRLVLQAASRFQASGCLEPIWLHSSHLLEARPTLVRQFGRIGQKRVSNQEKGISELTQQAEVSPKPTKEKAAGVSGRAGPSSNKDSAGAIQNPTSTDSSNPERDYSSTSASKRSEISKEKLSFRTRLENLRDKRETSEQKKPKHTSSEDRLDPQSDGVTKEDLSYMHLAPQRLPKKVEQRIAAVFGKYPHSELRKMGREYLKFYQLLHATEKAVDITKFEKVCWFLNFRLPFRTRLICTRKLRTWSGR